MAQKESEGPWYAGVTRYQWFVLLVAWLGWVFDIADTAIFNLVKTPMMKEMLGEARYAEVGPALEARIQVFFLLGWSIGGLLFGILADRWGRTKTLSLTILIYCLFTGLTAACQTPDQVLVVRFLTALGIGGEWAAGAALLAEVFPARARAGAAGLLQSAAAFGPVMAALANLGLASMNWRWIFIVGIVPAFVVVLIRAGVKEPERQKVADSTPFFATLTELFRLPEYRRRVIVATIVGVVGIAGAGTVAFWLPNLVEAAMPGASKTDIQATKSYVTFAQHAGTLFGVLVSPWVAERLGRRVALGLFFLACPIVFVLLALGAKTVGALYVLAPLASFFTIGLTGIYPLYFPELFPARFRATGAGFAYNTGRILSAPMPALTAALMGPQKSVAIGVALSGAIYVLGLLALPFAVETMGKPLPED